MVDWTRISLSGGKHQDREGPGEETMTGPLRGYLKPMGGHSTATSPREGLDLFEKSSQAELVVGAKGEVF